VWVESAPGVAKNALTHSVSEEFFLLFFVQWYFLEFFLKILFFHVFQFQMEAHVGLPCGWAITRCPCDPLNLCI